MTYQRKTGWKLSLLHFALALLAFLALCAADVFGYAYTMTGYAALYKVSPKNAGDNLFDAREANSILRGKHSLGVFERAKLGANFSDLFRGKQTVWRDGPTLAPHIINVVLMSANEEMVRANTGWVIAVMANDHSRGNFALHKSDGKYVRSLAEAFPVSEDSIAVFVPVSHPKPARFIFGFLNFSPKTGSNIFRVSSVSADTAAKLRAAAIKGIGRNGKRLLAGLTVGDDSVFIQSSHFKSPKFDLVRGVGAQQRSGISLKTKPLYHKVATPAVEKTTNNSTAAQTCTPPLFQGYPNSCSTINLRWLNRDAISLIDHYEIYIGTQLRGTAPANAISFSDPVGCGFGATYTITQVMRSGARCSTVTTGNPPHTSPCHLCGGGAQRFSAVNAATYGQNAAPSSIIALFHENFGASPPDSASFLPLPFSLRGLSVQIGGHQAGLFYVSSTQINVMVPSGAFGLAPIVVTRPDGGLMYGDIPLFDSLPGLFTLNSSGTGLAATNIERRANETLLVLWGTGFNFFHGKPGYADTGRAEINLGGQWYEALYVGDSPGLVGVQQLNFAIPNVFAVGTKGAFVRITLNDGRTWQTQGVDVRFP